MSIDSDSKLDLDAVAAGHPVAMRELAELRDRCRKLEGIILKVRALSDENAPGIETMADLRCGVWNATYIPLLPAPGVAQEPFEEWHRRECPEVLFRKKPCDNLGHWLRADWTAPEGMRSKEQEAELMRRFHQKSCREVYESEVAAKSGEECPEFGMVCKCGEFLSGPVAATNHRCKKSGEGREAR